MTDYILIIDEGTTSTRAMLFGLEGTHHGTAQRELTQYYPRPGWVEHDAEEIWQYSITCARELIEKVGGPHRIAAIGIANQRETVVVWDRQTGKPLAPALVWQDRRTADKCQIMREQGHEALVQDKTGLLLDPYFSASKIGWLLDQNEDLRDAGEKIACGTIDSYLVARLTGGLHISDATNSSRTSLMALESGQWDEELCALFGVNQAILPEIVDTAGQFGKTHVDIFGLPIPICGLVGDQQGALIGQACFTNGQTKATFGTGAFILTYVGTQMPHSRHRLLSTIAWQMNGTRHFALEGSVFVAGSLIKWLRDELGLIQSATETEDLARSISSSEGVVLVPALSGLGAPHWKPHAKAALTGLNFSTGKPHIVRAALEAMAHQCHDLKIAFAQDGHDWRSLAVDGGMVENVWLNQDLADILDVAVTRPNFSETTALGAAMLAAVGAGIYPDLLAASAMRSKATHFRSQMTIETRSNRLTAWNEARNAVVNSA